MLDVSYIYALDIISLAFLGYIGKKKALLRAWLMMAQI